MVVDCQGKNLRASRFQAPLLSCAQPWSVTLGSHARNMVYTRKERTGGGIEVGICEVERGAPVPYDGRRQSRSQETGQEDEAEHGSRCDSR